MLVLCRMLSQEFQRSCFQSRTQNLSEVSSVSSNSSKHDAESSQLRLIDIGSFLSGVLVETGDFVMCDSQEFHDFHPS